MKVVIVEDERLAVDRLKGFLEKYDAQMEVLADLPSVKKAVDWFSSNLVPDLILLDIHLEDGQSFGIFDQISLDCPVIFITAFDEYLIKAFKLNSVDYLLKPVNFQELGQALDKFKKYHTPIKSFSLADFQQILNPLVEQKLNYKERFLVSSGSKIQTVPVDQVAYFYSEEKITFLVNRQGQRFPLDLSLDKLQEVMNPSIFFRINRKFIASLESISQINKYSPTRLKLGLLPDPKQEVFVSIERYSQFKDWLDR
ncbi:LytR/AlgR family response regulator transcription factor [Aquiflexum gelatinilyticum]|uniref:LytTR family DNA-binding domain-containing protein n=1 Tax=Aquiflexum gelatinilyticum TaxID=2961943 RepID=A0A9X2T0K7_9BACT|nr:LytTR family DNA-binding domain-containing protein [Aquiflexum gelatinilyticum]MCR9015708.1 LytTR family DNA-binding domain-containing protein [Aquiflexum gelatinilyticum]